jgi:hypothetical protein
VEAIAGRKRISRSKSRLNKPPVNGLGVCSTPEIGFLRPSSSELARVLRTTLLRHSLYSVLNLDRPISQQELHQFEIRLRDLLLAEDTRELQRAPVVYGRVFGELGSLP